MERKKIACFIWSSSVTGRDVLLYRLWQLWVGGTWWPPNLEGSFLPSQKNSRLFTWSKIQSFPFNCKCHLNGGDCLSHSGCPSLYRVISGFLSFFVGEGTVVSYTLHFEGYKSLRGLGEPEKNFVKRFRIKKKALETSLVVQWLRLHTPNAGALGFRSLSGN